MPSASPVALEDTAAFAENRSAKRRRLNDSPTEDLRDEAPQSRRGSALLAPPDDLSNGDLNSSPNGDPQSANGDLRSSLHISREPSDSGLLNRHSPSNYDRSTMPSPSHVDKNDLSLDADTSESALSYRCTHVLRGHRLAVSALQFSPDGTRIASASSDATAKIWMVEDSSRDPSPGFKLVHTLVGHLAGISSLAWAPDSSLLATGSDDKTIRFWNAITGAPYPKALRGHHNAVYSLAFSPKGNMLVSGSVDEAVFLWNVRAARLMRSLPAHSDPVTSVDFVRDGTLIASGSSDGLIRIWDTATGQCLRTIFHEDKPLVTSVKFSPNGRFVATWMLDSSVRLWDYVQGRCVKTYKGHENVKYSIGGAFGTYGAEAGYDEDQDEDVMDDISEQGSEHESRERRHAFIVSGSEDGSIVIWDVITKAVLQKMAGHSGTVFDVDIHRSQKMLASCGADGCIRIWQNVGDLNGDHAS